VLFSVTLPCHKSLGTIIIAGSFSSYPSYPVSFTGKPLLVSMRVLYICNQFFRLRSVAPVRPPGQKSALEAKRASQGD